MSGQAHDADASIKARPIYDDTSWDIRSSTPTFTPSEQRRRWKGLQERLREIGVSAALLSQSRNVLYYAGIAAHGHVIVPAVGNPIFLVQIDFERAKSVTAMPDVMPSKGLPTVVQTLQEFDLHAGLIGIESDSLPFAAYMKLRERLPGATFVDVGADVLEQRMVKSAEEVECLRAAARISDTLFRRVESTARPGVSEIELSAELGALQRQLGADGLSSKHGFNDRTIEHGWLTSGPNTSQVSGYWLTMSGFGPSPARPYGPTARAIDVGDLICYDAGTSFRGYHSDHARTWTMGPPQDRQRRYWEALLEMQATAIAAVVPGQLASDVYDAAASVAKRLGLMGVFMAQATHDFQYVGHGVGVEIDEPPMLTPRNRTVLKEGMTLAIEPKLIVPGWGGLTIEDTLVITADGADILTTSSTELEIRY